MAFTIDNTLTTMRVSAGEPIVFSYQPTDPTGQPDDLTGRIFVFSIYDNARTNYGQFEAVNSRNTATWKLSGLVTEDLLGKSGLLWEVAERLDDGRDVIANGSLTIDMSAPTIIDYNSAPISRYITKIVGSVRNFVCGRADEHYAAMALMKRSPKMTANWAFAMVHSRGGILHSFSERFKIR